jgi:periplasmic protein TonB
MLRLRTTTTLSVLTLAVSVAGTQWLSDQAGGGAEPVARHAAHYVAVHPVAAQRLVHRSHPHAPHATTHAQPHYVAAPVAAPVASPDDKVAWVPVSMPISSLPFAQTRHHDAGNLVLHLVVDGQGLVTQATVAQSSGDAMLDANALAIARQWRFAVPPQRPYGFSGDLPLSFTDESAQLAQMR